MTKDNGISKLGRVFLNAQSGPTFPPIFLKCFFVNNFVFSPQVLSRRFKSVVLYLFGFGFFFFVCLLTADFDYPCVARTCLSDDRRSK